MDVRSPVHSRAPWLFKPVYELILGLGGAFHICLVSAYGPCCDLFLQLNVAHFLDSFSFLLAQARLFKVSTFILETLEVDRLLL